MRIDAAVSAHCPQPNSPIARPRCKHWERVLLHVEEAHRHDPRLGSWVVALFLAQYRCRCSNFIIIAARGPQQRLQVWVRSRSLDLLQVRTKGRQLSAPFVRRRPRRVERKKVPHPNRAVGPTRCEERQLLRELGGQNCDRFRSSPVCRVVQCMHAVWRLDRAEHRDVVGVRLVPQRALPVPRNRGDDVGAKVHDIVDLRNVRLRERVVGNVRASPAALRLYVCDDLALRPLHFRPVPGVVHTNLTVARAKDELPVTPIEARGADFDLFVGFYVQHIVEVQHFRAVDGGKRIHIRLCGHHDRHERRVVVSHGEGHVDRTRGGNGAPNVDGAVAAHEVGENDILAVAQLRARSCTGEEAHCRRGEVHERVRRGERLQVALCLHHGRSEANVPRTNGPRLVHRVRHRAERSEPNYGSSVADEREERNVLAHAEEQAPAENLVVEPRREQDAIA